MPNELFLEPMKLSIESGLTSAGDTISVSDHIDVDSFQMGARSIGLESGFDYDIVLTNSGEGILATGLVRGTFQTECDRCLAPTSFDIAAEVSCYYLFAEPEDGEDEDEDFGLVDASDGTVDLSEAIQGAIAAEIPFVILCREDCKGLCPVCGCNLNEQTCSCEREPLELQRENPFAALAALKFDDDDYRRAEESAARLAETAAMSGQAGDPDVFDDEDADDGEDDLSDEEFEALWERRNSVEK